MNETKSGEVLAKKTPLAFCDGKELLTKTLVTLKNTGKSLKCGTNGRGGTAQYLSFCNTTINIVNLQI